MKTPRESERPPQLREAAIERTAFGQHPDHEQQPSSGDERGALAESKRRRSHCDGRRAGDPDHLEAIAVGEQITEDTAREDAVRNRPDGTVNPDLGASQQACLLWRWATG